MKTYSLIVAVVVLLLAGEVLRRAATLEERLGTAEQEFVLGTATPAATAALDDATAGLGKVPIFGSRAERVTRTHQATRAYWKTDYELVRSLSDAPADQTDPDLRILNANAAFRQALIQYRTPPALARALEDVLRGYAVVLDTDPESTTAAYNYEFVARLRAALSASRGATTPSLAPQDMHGDQGQPPDAGQKSDFNVIVPLRPEERQDQLTPGTGAVFERKG